MLLKRLLKCATEFLKIRSSIIIVPKNQNLKLMIRLVKVDYAYGEVIVDFYLYGKQDGCATLVFPLWQLDDYAGKLKRKKVDLESEDWEIEADCMKSITEDIDGLYKVLQEIRG